MRPLQKLQTLIGKYVVCSSAQRLILALWIVHTHLADRFDTTPYLTVMSPQKQCGKSRLLEVIQLLVPRPWYTVIPSEAVVYRYVDASMPTLLLDEVDAIFAPRNAERHEGLRSILNAGFRRSATVPRCIGTNSTPQNFRVYCPKVIAGIGTLPDTITDRAIPIWLQRKKSNEPVARFFIRTAAAEAEPIRAAIESWASKNADEIAAARPEMPPELSDRMIEGCEPLVAIADALGYGQEARAALVELLVTNDRLDSQENAEIRLLRDVKGLFDSDPTTHALLTSALCLRLNADGWSDWYGHGMTDRHLAALLRPYEIKSRSVRQGADTGKGYHRNDFEDVWERYLNETDSDDAE